jgi:hypothetical protein
MVPKKGKTKNWRQNYVNASNDNFVTIPNVINVVATINKQIVKEVSAETPRVN